MKKLISIMLVFVVSLALAGVAMAAKPAPAAVSCWDWSNGFKTVLSIKPWSGDIAISGGKIKFYAIHGEVSVGSYSAPVSGTGHMQDNIFHFSFSGTLSSGRIWTYEFVGFWDVVDKIGEGSYLAGVKDQSASDMNALSSTDEVFVSGNCKTTVIPQIADGDIDETDLSPDDGP